MWLSALSIHPRILQCPACPTDGWKVSRFFQPIEKSITQNCPLLCLTAYRMLDFGR